MSAAASENLTKMGVKIEYNKVIGNIFSLDELFELLTLIQTGKSRKPCPIVLFGREFWDEVVDFEALVNWGTVDRDDLELFSVVETVDEAFTFLQDSLTRLHRLGKETSEP